MAPRTKNKMWKSKDGGQIHVSEMSDSHLDNTIKMFDRGLVHGLKPNKWHKILLKEAETREEAKNESEDLDMGSIIE